MPHIPGYTCNANGSRLPLGPEVEVRSAQLVCGISTGGLLGLHVDITSTCAAVCFTVQRQGSTWVSSLCIFYRCKRCLLVGARPP